MFTSEPLDLVAILSATRDVVIGENGITEEPPRITGVDRSKDPLGQIPSGEECCRADMAAYVGTDDAYK